MINFVEIPLADPSFLNAHEQLDSMLSDGWQIIGHAVYTYDGEPTERYTLHRDENTSSEWLMKRAKKQFTPKKRPTVKAHIPLMSSEAY